MRIHIATLFVLIASAVYATHDKGLLSLEYPGKVRNLPFGSVRVVDNRFDTVNIGFIQTGAFNRGRTLHFGQPFTAEMELFHQRIMDSPATAGPRLLILVRNFFLSERSGTFNEKGFFTYTATYFISNGNDTGSYRKLFDLDEVFICKAGDVTGELKASAGKELAGVLERAGRSVQTDQQVWSLEAIRNWVATQKKYMPLYQVALPAFGIYMTYEELKNNTPSDTGLIVDSSGLTKVFYRRGTKKKPVEIEPGTVYAVCDGIRLYRCTDFAFYRFRREGDDFYIIGRSSAQTAPHEKEGVNPALVATAGLVGGVFLGVAVVSMGGSKSLQGVLCKYRIDPLTGNLVFIERKE